MKKQQGQKSNADRSARAEEAGRRDRRGDHGREDRNRRNSRDDAGKIRSCAQRQSRSAGAFKEAQQGKKIRNSSNGGACKVGKMSTDARQKEIDGNLEYFLKELPNIPAAQRGKFALIRHQKIEAYYDTVADALRSAANQHKDMLFSIQEVGEVSADLGFYTHAVHLGAA